MRQVNSKNYEFGEFRLDVAERTLTQAGKPVVLTPKVFDLLAILVENHGHLMTKEELIKQLWQDSFVEEANLNVNISTLRRILGETPTEHKFIETLPRQGYRFVADVDTFESTDVGNSGLHATVVARPAAGPRSRLVRYLAPIGIAVLLTAGLITWRLYLKETATEVSQLRTLAVLPFRPLAGGQSDVALQMGMADTLITKLNALEQLTVRPTSSIERYTDTNDPLAVGRELQVEAVLDGKIQRDENRIRVTVQLLRVSDGATLWTGSFDDFFTNIFAVQDSISERMLESLAVKLSRKEEVALAKRYTENTEAYQLFLQGQFHHEQISRAGTENALKYYLAAVEKDPDYALVYAAMTPAYIHLANLNIDRETNIQNSRDSAARAVSLDPALADAHEALGGVLEVLDWNWGAAEIAYKRAIELNPKREGPHFNYSSYLSRQKRHDEAVQEIEAARRINPVALYIQNQLIHTMIRARRYDEALAEAKKSLAMSPENSTALAYMFRILMHQSRVADAGLWLDRYIAAKGPHLEAYKGWYGIASGRQAEGEKSLREAVERYKREGIHGLVALSYVRLGEFDLAFASLETAFTRREHHVLTLNVDPDWDPIRSDPRFGELVKRIGLPN